MNTNVIQVDFTKHIRLTGIEKVLLRAIWKQLLVNREYTTWAKDVLSIFEENQDFGLLDGNVKQSGRGGHNRIDHWVTVDTAKEICMLSRTDEGRRVRRFFIECERLVYEHGFERDLTVIPGILNSDFLQSVADNFKRLEAERNEAIRTKAEISDRKTATAMNTASQAIKTRNRVMQLVKAKDETIEKLNQRLGESEEWSSAVVAACRYPQLGSLGQNRLGRLLAKRSREMGIEVRRAESERYPNGIGIYHNSVVRKLVEDHKVN